MFINRLKFLKYNVLKNEKSTRNWTSFSRGRQFKSGNMTKDVRKTDNLKSNPYTGTPCFIAFHRLQFYKLKVSPPPAKGFIVVVWNWACRISEACLHLKPKPMSLMHCKKKHLCDSAHRYCG